MKSGIYQIIVCRLDDRQLKLKGIPSKFETYKIAYFDIKYFKNDIKRMGLKIYSQHEINI